MGCYRVAGALTQLTSRSGQNRAFLLVLPYVLGSGRPDAVRRTLRTNIVSHPSIAHFWKSVPMRTCAMTIRACKAEKAIEGWSQVCLDPDRRRQMGLPIGPVFRSRSARIVKDGAIARGCYLMRNTVQTGTAGYCRSEIGNSLPCLVLWLQGAIPQRLPLWGSHQIDAFKSGTSLFRTGRGRRTHDRNCRLQQF